MEEKIIALLEEAMELDKGSVAESDLLAEKEEWDSLSRLTFMALCKKELEIGMQGDELLDSVTVRDVIEQVKAKG